MYEHYEDEKDNIVSYIGMKPYFNYRNWKKQTLEIHDALVQLGESTGFKNREVLENRIDRITDINKRKEWCYQIHYIERGQKMTKEIPKEISIQKIFEQVGHERFKPTSQSESLFGVKRINKKNERQNTSSTKSST